MKITRALIMGLAILLLASACSDEPGTKKTPYKKIEVSRAEKEIINSQQNLVFSLLKEANESTDNCALSPWGISTVLAMLANGTEGEMRDEILNVLDIADGDLDVMNQCAARLFQEFPTLDGQTTVRTAQSIWADGVTFLDDFAQVCSEYYNATQGTYSGKQDGADKINSWVRSVTDNMIQNAVTPSQIGAVAIVSANYFKGQWEEQFKTSDTRPMEFTNTDGTKREVPMMSHTYNYYSYQENCMCQAVDLPYGNGNYYMKVILPREGVTVNELLQTPDSLEWYMKMVPCTVKLKLPRFEFETRGDIIDILKRLGVEKLWEEPTNRMCNTDILMSQFIHGVRIKVDEEGTVAASYTYTKGEATSVMPGAVVTMEVVRPFIFMIRESSTGTCLFAGVVNQL